MPRCMHRKRNTLLKLRAVGQGQWVGSSSLDCFLEDVAGKIHFERYVGFKQVTYERTREQMKGERRLPARRSTYTKMQRPERIGYTRGTAIIS